MLARRDARPVRLERQRRPPHLAQHPGGDRVVRFDRLGPLRLPGPDVQLGGAEVGQAQLLDELIKKYPNHEDLKKWKARADEIKSKIDPDANRQEQFKPGCLWAEGNYKEAFVNVNYAKVAIDHQDWAAAHDGLNYADRNLGFLRQRIKDSDRVNAWPPGAAEWVTASSADVAKMTDLVKGKLK